MRARNLKPGTFKNEILGTRDPHLTLLFQGLWCLADRDGRLEDRPLRIKAEVFPYRDVDVDAMLNELQDCGFIQRYEVAGRKYLYVINFPVHQNPHHTERKSSIPAPVSSPLKHGEYPADSLIPDSLVLTPSSPSSRVVTVPLPEENTDILAPEGVDECVEAIQRAWKKPEGQAGMAACFEAFQFESERKKMPFLEAAKMVRDKTLIIAGLMAEWPPGEQKFIPKLSGFMKSQGYEQPYATWERRSEQARKASVYDTVG